MTGLKPIQNARVLAAMERLNIPNLTKTPLADTENLNFTFDLGQGGFTQLVHNVWASPNIDVSVNTSFVIEDEALVAGGPDDFQIDVMNRYHEFLIRWTAVTAPSLFVLGQWRLGAPAHNFRETQVLLPTQSILVSMWAPRNYGTAVQFIGGGASDVAVVQGHTFMAPEGVEMPFVQTRWEVR